jgi:hypothetical protein
LSDLLETTEAWRYVHRPEVVQAMSPDELLEAMQLAGYDEESSQAAGTRLAMAKMRSGGQRQ